MSNSTFTTVRTVRTPIEGDVILSALRAAGLHPVDLSLSPHFSVAGTEISYAIDVPTQEAVAARDLLESYAVPDNAS